MANLSKQIRSPHSPSPIYGDGSLRLNNLVKNQGLLRPGFTIGDLDHQYAGSLPVYGTFSNGVLTAQTSTADAVGTTIHPNARAVKITVNVTGTGTVEIVAKTAADGTTVVFDSAALAAGTYEFYVGGWSSPVGDTTNGAYLATQYGPVKPGSTPTASDPTGDQELVSSGHADPAADSNYVGGSYNPVLFTSLDGFDLVFTSIKTGTASWDVEVTPIS